MRPKQALAAVVAAFGIATTTTTTAAEADVPAPVPGALERHEISGTYVAGVSSGGYMANQLHVAHSAVFQGAAIFAAGPYECSQGNLGTALYACMDTFLTRRTPAQLAELTRDRAAAGSVDPVANLSGDPVWLLHGANDQTVKRAVNDDLAAYYRRLGADVVYDTGTAAGHGWVSPRGSVPCSATASPYVNDCGGDQQGDMLGHLFGDVAEPATSPGGRLIRFDQDDHAPGGDAGAISLGEEGFAYVPPSCESGPCRLVVALHGCYQYHGLIGDAFMAQANLNEYADTNDMIVLYPQATTALDNPRGCFNWWGYGGDAQYAQKGGKQITAIMNMAGALGAGGDGGDPGPAPGCVTASNYAHTVAGRAYHSAGRAYAIGSGQPLGLWNSYVETALRRTGPFYWERC